MKSKSKEYLIKECDRVFSIVIRQMYCNNEGMVNCSTCVPIQEKKHWTRLTCGHFRKRRHMATRWNLKNAAPQCVECNSNDLDLYQFLCNKYSKEEVDNVIIESNKIVQYKIFELQEILKNLTQLIKNGL